LMVIVSACICAIACIVAFLVMMPKPLPHDPTLDLKPQSSQPGMVPDQKQTSSENNHDKSSGSQSSSTHHYHVGDPIPAAPPVDPPKNDSPTFTKQEESGDFWQY
ncbi:MAG: hypothetical protein K2Z81_11495, partial [Cyanobacteria bacterium]|nr:hypothetical protein [Cyanobacteriota bacterium]